MQCIEFWTESVKMGTFEDLTGKTFGKLTVLHRAPDYIQPSGQHKRMWHCRCECGNECDVRASDLKSGNTNSCGCFQQLSRGMAQFEDLTGQRFGRLIVLYRLPNHVTPSGQKKRMWKCKCDCGNEVDVYASQLKTGLDSCGCIKRERAQQRKLDRLKAQKEKEQRDHLSKIKMVQQRKLDKLKAQKEKTQQKVDEKKKIQEVKKAKEQKYLESHNLAVTYPEIAREWDIEKNGDISPALVLPSSSKKYWWICPNKHSYSASPSNRTHGKGSGCPYCSDPARKVLKGFNDLQTKHPVVASEWNYQKNNGLKPDEVLCGSAKKVWWLGKCGHEYEQSIVNRVKGGNCPYCSHQKLLIGFNDFASEHPELLSEWDYEKNEKSPTEIMSHSKYKAWWNCPFGHSYQAWMDNRCGSAHSGCPICDKENHTSFPEQALFFYIKQSFSDAVNSNKSAIGMELDIYIPSKKTAIEYDGRNWHKNNQFEIKKNATCLEKGIVLIRIREPGLCLYDNCLCIVREDVKSNHSLNKSIKEVLTIIDSAREYNIDIDRDSVTIYDSYISNRKNKSLKSLYPKIASEWHPSKNGRLTPEMVAPLAEKKAWWLGKCGHEWQMSVQDRTNQNCGCPICAGKRIVSGENDLLSNYPDLCEEWDYKKNAAIGLFPDKVAPHSDKKAWWICSVCGNSWNSKIDSRTRMKAGCPECSKVLVSKSKYKSVLCEETGQIYESLQEAEKQTGINRHGIGSCCRGKQQTAGKYHWKYIKREED